MNRIRDYFGFIGWFTGLGYVVLWPLTAEGLTGKPFGAAVFCRDGVFGVLDLLCNLPHPLQLPPGLHALGFSSAAFVAVRLLHYTVKRARRAATSRAVSLTVAMQRMQAAVPPRPRQKPKPPRMIKPRDNFGLRGRLHRRPAADAKSSSSDASRLG